MPLVFICIHIFEITSSTFVTEASIKLKRKTQSILEVDGRYIPNRKHNSMQEYSMLLSLCSNYISILHQKAAINKHIYKHQNKEKVHLIKNKSIISTFRGTSPYSELMNIHIHIHIYI